MTRARPWLAGLVLVAACGAEDQPLATGEAPPATPAAPCPVSEAEVDGACVPAGIPPEACGAGFAPNGRRGCDPVLPAEACPSGRRAALGQTVCAPVAPCPAGRFAADDAADDAVHVDAEADPALADGSAAHPYATLVDGLDAAAEGGLVLLAAGVYAGARIERGVRVVGTCPEATTIRGDGQHTVIEVDDAASAVELRGLTVEHGNGGIATGTTTTIRDARFHDLRHFAIGAGGEATDVLTVERVLIEDVAYAGLEVIGFAVDVRDLTVRHVAFGPAFADYGFGVLIRSNGSEDGTAAIRGVVVDDARTTGIAAQGREVLVEGCFVRGTGPAASGFEGFGASATRGGLHDEIPARLTLRDSVLAENLNAGLFVLGSEATVERTVVRDTRSRPADRHYGGGIDASPDVEDDGGSAVAVGSLVVRDSVVEGNQRFGIRADTTPLLAERVLVAATRPEDAGGFGHGIEVEENPFAAGYPGAATLRDTAVIGAHEAGILVVGSPVTLENVHVSDVAAPPDGDVGRGLSLQGSRWVLDPRPVVVRRAYVGNVREVGVFVRSTDAVLEDVTVRDVAPSDAGIADGIAAVGVLGETAVRVSGARVEGVARVGVLNVSASVALGGSTICAGTFLAAQEEEGRPFTFRDDGGNACRCDGAPGDAARACVATSTSLAYPAALATPVP